MRATSAQVGRADSSSKRVASTSRSRGVGHNVASLAAAAVATAAARTADWGHERGR